MAALVVCAVWLFHTTAIDRLAISKLAFATVLAAIVLGAQLVPRPLGSFLARLGRSPLVQSGPGKAGHLPSAERRAPSVGRGKSPTQPSVTGEKPSAERRAPSAGRGKSPTQPSVTGAKQNSQEATGPAYEGGVYPVLGIVGICLLVASLLFGAFVGARVEGWAPWIVAGVLFSLVRLAPRARVGGVFTVAVAILAIVGIVQALGGGWFTSELSGFSGRAAMGTLGNPDHFGICLAGALPFVLVRARKAHFAVVSALVVAAIVLSGSRTAWVMLLPSIVVGVMALGTLRATALSMAGLLVGVAIGLTSPQIDLEGRVADFSDRGGTAAGRLYLWSVHWELVSATGPVGSGPEGFRRVWPWAQARHLEAHPDEVGFHSDLRHAHADIVEFLVDWGWVGLAIGLTWLVKLLWPGLLRRRRRAPDGQRNPRGEVDGSNSTERLAAYGSIFALLLGGLASSVLFQPSSLFLGALAAGVLAPRQTVVRSRLWQVAGLVAVAVTLFWVGQRTVSEVHRTAGLRMEMMNRPLDARELYGRAVDVDPENSLALVMHARSLIPVDPDRAVDVATRAAEHLPTPSVYAVVALAAEAAGESELAAESWALYRLLYPER